MVLIFVDHSDGHIKKSSFEALSYGVDLAAKTGATAEALILGTVNGNLADLGKYGITKVNQVDDETLNHVDVQVFSKLIAEAASITKCRCGCFFTQSNR